MSEEMKQDNTNNIVLKFKGTYGQYDRLLNLLESGELEEKLGVKVTDLKASSLRSKPRQMRESQILEWFNHVVEQLQNGWEYIYQPTQGAVAMGNEKSPIAGFKKHLTIEGKPYELTIRCRDRATNTWDFFLEPSHPSQSIPEGYQLRLLTESLEIFEEEEAEEEKEISIENLQLQSGQKLIWETEPKPDDYQPEVLCF